MILANGQITRWAVLVALSLATVVMFAVSLRGNYLYGYSLGQTDEKRQLFAWANVAADVWKAFGLLAISVLWRTKHRRAAAIACVAWLVCLLFGVNSALGVYVQDRAAMTGTREAAHATYKDAERELAGAEDKLRKLPTHRSVGEIEASINGVLGRAVLSGERLRGTVGALSQTCTKIDTRTIEDCKEFAQLREEFAVAAEAARLEARASVLRGQVIALRDHGGSVLPDPVGEFYAWISRGVVSVRDVGFGFPLFFALLIEVVSAFGPMTIAAYAEASRDMRSGVHVQLQRDAPGRSVEQHDKARHSLTADVALSEPETGSVVTWIAERAAPAGDNIAVGIEQLHADYITWCNETDARAAWMPAFEEELDRIRALPELAGKIRKFSGRYYGIALVRSHMRALRSGRSG